MATNLLQGWQVDPQRIRTVGRDLQRPECILAEPDGTLWTADARGGVVRIAPDGTQELVAQTVDTRFAASLSAERYTMAGTLPNGLAFAPNGDLLIANFGTCAIERMTRDGRSMTLYTHIDGEPLGKTNFVLTDSRGRIWFTVTTRLEPWTRSINERTADGYVGLIDESGIRIVADGFVGTNEIRFDAREEWLYVVESNARRISRLRAQPDGSLRDRELYGPSNLGGIPDGFAFDAAGNLWITLVNAERLIALTPEGGAHAAGRRGPGARQTLGRALLRRHDDPRDPRLGPRHARADDGQRHLRRPRPAHRLPRQPDGHHDPVLPLTRARAADGAPEARMRLSEANAWWAQLKGIPPGQRAHHRAQPPQLC